MTKAQPRFHKFKDMFSSSPPFHVLLKLLGLLRHLAPLAVLTSGGNGKGTANIT